MKRLRKLDDSNSLFLKVTLPDGTECLHMGTMQEIADSVGVDCPWVESSLISMVERVYDGCKVEKISASQAAQLAKRVQDSNSKVILL